MRAAQRRREILHPLRGFRITTRAARGDAEESFTAAGGASAAKRELDGSEFRRGGRGAGEGGMGRRRLCLGGGHLLGYTARPVEAFERLTGGVKRAPEAGLGSAGADYSRLSILEAHAFIRQTAHKQDGARLTRNEKYFHAQNLCGERKRWRKCVPRCTQ